jgi:hypothetical protein
LLTIAISGLTVEWFILLWLAILLTIAISGLTVEWFILLWLAILLTIAISGLTEVWFILFCYSVCVCLFEIKIKVVFWSVFSDAAGDIVDHYCLRFVIAVVHIVVVG